MSKIEQILICEYFLPIAVATIVVSMAERKQKTHPCRDTEEYAGRVVTGFCAMILFSFIQAIIRSQ